jgi:hypothetical protein
MREMKNAYKILVRKPEVKRPLGRSRLDGIDLVKIGWKEYGLHLFGQDRDQ